MPIYMNQTHCIIQQNAIVVQFQITLIHINVGYKTLYAHICMLSFKDINAF
jgi:hypothetical protein